jgi:hypothetical protein
MTQLAASGAPKPKAPAKARPKASRQRELEAELRRRRSEPVGFDYDLGGGVRQAGGTGDVEKGRRVSYSDVLDGPTLGPDGKRR